MIPEEKLRTLTRRLAEIESHMCDPKVTSDAKRLRELGRERSNIEPVVVAKGSVTWRRGGRRGSIESLARGFPI